MSTPAPPWPADFPPGFGDDGESREWPYHGPLDHDACCTLPLGCAGGCEQPGGCMDPDPATRPPDTDLSWAYPRR